MDADEFDLSVEMVTVLSLIFTLVSISLSVAEYCLSKKLRHSQILLFVSFEALSNDFSAMSHNRFQSQVVFIQYGFLNTLARRLKIETGLIDRLKPVQTSNGAQFQLIIDAQHQSDSVVTHSITKEILAKVTLYRLVFYTL